MGVEAFEAPGSGRAADPRVELGPDRPLFCICAREARRKRRLVSGRACEPLDPPGSLEARDGGDEAPTGHVELRRERPSRLVARELLGDSWASERAANGDTLERSRFAAELEGDELTICHKAEARRSAARQTRVQRGNQSRPEPGFARREARRRWLRAAKKEGAR